MGRSAAAGRVVLGIGDDCSILRAATGDEILVTTDFSLEGVHFRRDWHPAESVGHRCLARGLSDIAAMGGEPMAAFVSLALPATLPQRWVDGFYQGVLKLAAQFKVELAGGDTAQSPAGILADIVVTGSAPKGAAIRRSGARPGDRIFVTGTLGGAAATLDLLYSNESKKLTPKKYPSHFFPIPQIQLGQVLRQQKLASSMIDTSDGLSTDLAHICEESGVGAEIWESAIPLGKIGRPPQAVDLAFALHGGEDYQLLFTSRASVHMPRTIAGVQVTEIGRITRGTGTLLQRSSGKKSKLKPDGWQHFKKSR